MSIENLIGRIEESLDPNRSGLNESNAAAYRDRPVVGLPVDTKSNQRRTGGHPPFVARSVAAMTGLELGVIEQFMQHMQSGDSIATAAKALGLTMGQATDVKGALDNIGVTGNSEQIAEQMRLIGDYFYRIGDMVENEEVNVEDAAELAEDIEVLFSDEDDLCEAVSKAATMKLHRDTKFMKEAVMRLKSAHDIAKAGTGEFAVFGALNGVSAYLEWLDRKVKKHGVKVRYMAKASQEINEIADALVKLPNEFNESTHEDMGDDEDYLDPTGFQKYIPRGTPATADAKAMVAAYGRALADNITASHPGRVKFTWGSPRGDDSIATLDGHTSDNKVIQLIANMDHPETPYIQMKVPALNSIATMKLTPFNWMNPLGLFLQMAVRALMQTDFDYSEVEAFKRV